MKPHRPRLVIADDHRLLVQGLQGMLEKRFDVVALAYTGAELLSVLRTVPADGLILDISLPDRNGIEMLPEIHAIQPGLRVLVVTMHVDRTLAEAALAAGASGFVPKDSRMDELETALEKILAGERYLSPRIPKTSHRVGLDAVHAGLSRVTPRQQQILGLIGQGKTSAEIGDALGLSANTITFHRARIRKILGLSSEWELGRFAILVYLAANEGGDAPAG